ncbi:MAG: hypothetical protein ABIN05_04175 [candidate division WOR-3 bacterium]
MNLFRSLKISLVIFPCIRVFALWQYFDDSENIKNFFNKEIDFEKVLYTKSVQQLEILSKMDRFILFNDSLINVGKLPQNYVQEYLYLKNNFKEKKFDIIVSYEPKFLKDSLKTIFYIFKGYSYYYLNDLENSLKISSEFKGDLSNILKIISLYKLQKYDDCIKTIEEFENFVNYPEIFKTYINLNFMKKNYEKLDYFCDLFLAKYLEDKDYYYVVYIKSQILFKKGYFKKSLDFVNQVILNEKYDSILLGNAYYLAGKNYFMLGDYDKMENFLNVFRESNISSDFKKNALFLDGKGFFLKGDYKKAIKKLEDFSIEFPEDELTIYADQMIAESYFNLKNYKKFKEYLTKRNYPDFIKDKMIYLKYFVDYKDGLYPDSIQSFISFINNEKNNPFKKNAYERIIEETDSDSLKIYYLKNYLIEFNRGEKVFQIFEKNIPFIYENLKVDFITTFFKSMDFSNEKVCKIFYLLLNYAYKNQMNYTFVINLIQDFPDNMRFYKDEVEYILINSLKNIGNYDAALILIDKKLKIKNIFSDSLLILQFAIYSQKNDIEKLTKLVENYDGGDIFIEAELNRFLGEKFFSLKMYSQAKEYFRKALVLYQDNREKVALVLTELAETHYALDEKENASIIAQQALFFANDINLINRIKLLIEK